MENDNPTTEMGVAAAAASAANSPHPAGEQLPVGPLPGGEGNAAEPVFDPAKGFTPENIEAAQRKREASGAAGTAPPPGQSSPRDDSGNAQVATQPTSAAGVPLYQRHGCKDEGEFETRLSATLEQAEQLPRVIEYARGLEARLAAIEKQSAQGAASAQGQPALVGVPTSGTQTATPPVQNYRYWSQALGMTPDAWSQLIQEEPYRAHELMQTHMLEKNPSVQALIKKQVESIVGPIRDKWQEYEKGWEGQRQTTAQTQFEQSVLSHADSVMVQYAEKFPQLKNANARAKVVEAVAGNWDEILYSASRTRAGQPVRALVNTIRAALADLGDVTSQAQGNATQARLQRITRQLSGGATGAANSGAADARDERGRFIAGKAEQGQDPSKMASIWDILSGGAKRNGLARTN